MDKVWWLYAGNKRVQLGKIGGTTIIIPVITTRDLKGAPAYLPLGRHPRKADAIKCAVNMGVIYHDDKNYIYRFTPDGVKHFI